MNVIEIDALAKRYGTVTAVTDVSLSIADGESFGYLGPNGAGKTTTIRCMLGLMRPSAGHIRILGRDVERDLLGVLDDVGYLPGEFGLWPSMTGGEVLDYLGALHPHSPTERESLRERFELARADLDKQVRFYSRGMRQKLGLIQAFQHEPRLAILDEPTEGLDPLMQERFIGLVEEYRAGGGTIFMSSHILSEVELATDRVGVIKAGRLVRVGSARDLTGGRVRTCTVTLTEPGRSGLFTLDGISDLVISDDGLHARFEFRGDMGPLIRRLARAPVLEFLAEPESLAEAFYDIYGDES
jgi:ABC-2 type transport system ATP-binding protein